MNKTGKRKSDFGIIRHFFPVVMSLLFYVICCKAHTQAAELTLDLTQPVNSGLAYQTWGAPGLDFKIFLTEEYIKNPDRYLSKTVTPDLVVGKDHDIYVKFVLKKCTDLVIRVAKNAVASNTLSCDLLLEDRETVAAHQTLNWKSGNYWEQEALTGVLPEGIYYLHFYDFREGSCAAYAGVFTLFAPYAAPADDDEVSGSNNSMEQAVKIKAGETKEGFLSYLGDDPEDWYTLNVTGEEASIEWGRTTKWYYGPLVFRVFRYEESRMEELDLGEENTKALEKGTYYACFSYKSNEPADGYLRRGVSYYLKLNQKEPETEAQSPGEGSSIPGSAQTSTPTPTPTPSPVPTAEPTPAPVPTITPTIAPSPSPSLPEGFFIYVGELAYKLENSEAIVVGPKHSDAKVLSIPASVRISGKKYKVTGIAPAALKNMRKLTTLTIGKNVAVIGKQGIMNCPKLKKIVIRTRLLTKASVKANAFRNGYAGAIVKCPAGMKTTYQKILSRKGMKKTVKFR